MSENELTRNVTIPLDDFLRIRDDADDFDLLLETIFKSAKYAPYSERIMFDDNELNNVLKYVAPNKYADTLGRLKESYSLKAKNGNDR